MFLYFDKNLTLKTKIDHGERPRQGSDLNITVCLDADFWTNPDNIKIWGVNGADLWVIKLVLTVPDNTQSIDYFTSDKGELRVFKKLYESEIVYDLVPGTSYYMYDFHFSAKEATQKFGKLTANLYFVRDITTDDYVKLASFDQWKNNYSSVILKVGEVGISYDNTNSEYKKMVGDGQATVKNLIDTATPIDHGEGNPKSTTSESGYYYDTVQQSVWIFKREDSQWVRALQFLPDDNVLGNFDETKAFGSAEITVEKTVGYAQKVIDQLISIKYEDIMREFTKVYAAINIAGTRPDWTETHSESPAFILNKPDLNKQYAELTDNLIQATLISPDKTYIVAQTYTTEGEALGFPMNGFPSDVDINGIDFGDGSKDYALTADGLKYHKYTDGVKYHLVSADRAKPKQPQLYDKMFMNCFQIDYLLVGNSANIPQNAFRESSLKKVVISDNVTDVDYQAFYYCFQLESVEFGENIQNIKERAFAYCRALTEIKLGAKITTIGKLAFYACPALKTISIEATTPPTLGENAFITPIGGPVTDYKCYVEKIFVPESAYEAYKTAWSAYADKIVYKVDNSHLTSKVDKLNSDSTDLTENSDVKVYAQTTDKEGYANASELNKAHTIVKRGANKEIKIGDAMQADEATSLGQLNTAKDDLNNNIAIDPNKTYVLFVGKTINISCGSSFSNYQIDMSDGTVYPKDTTVDGTPIEHIYAKDRAHLIAISGTAPNDAFDLAFSGTGNLYRVIQFADGIKKIGNVIGDNAVRVCVLPETLEEITAENTFAKAKVVYCPAANPPTIATGVFADSEKIFVKTSANTQYIEAWQSLSEKIVSEVDSSDLEDLKGIGTRLIQHISNINNPHKVTKEQVGLDKVDNTSDLDKPISKATQAALDQIDENIIINPDKTYLLFGGTTFAAPQVAYDIDFGDGTIYDKQSAINHTYTDGFDYHIITISTGSATTFSLGANSTTLGSDASFRVVHFAEGLTNIQTFGENVKTEVAIFPSTVTAIGSNVLNKVDLVYINADFPPTRGSASIEEAKKIFVKRTANTIYKNAQDWLLLANNIVHEIDSSDIIGAGLSDEDIARSVTLSNPSTATNGTLTELELSTLLASNLNFIIFNNEIYYLADKGHTEGIISYTHNGWNGAAIQNKSINITLSTRAWSLVTGSTDIKAFIHNIYIKGTDDGGNTVCEIRLKRLSAGATKITSIAGLASLIDNNQVVEASGYKLVNGNYLSVLWIKNNSLYTVPATSAVGNPAWYNFTSMTCEVEDTVDMFNFAK